MFPMGGLLQLIGLVVIVLVVLGVILMRRGARSAVGISGPTLVLRRFDVQESPRDGVFLNIAGRASGVIAWFLTVVGFDPETTLQVTGQRIWFRTSSLSGQTHSVIPLTQVASTHCGYSRPIGYLIFGLVVGIVPAIFGLLASLSLRGSDVPQGMLGAIGYAVIFGGIPLLLYWLRKKVIIYVETSGGMLIGLGFRPSVIENISVDLNKASQAVTLLNKKVVESQGAALPSAGARPDTRPAAVAGSCKKCGARLVPGSTFCDECGAPVG